MQKSFARRGPLCLLRRGCATAAATTGAGAALVRLLRLAALCLVRLLVLVTVLLLLLRGLPLLLPPAARQRPSDGIHGLPSSLQIIGPAYSENLLLRLGAAFEAEHQCDFVPAAMRGGL